MCHARSYAVDYSELFVDTVRPALAATGPDIYLDSSPSNGLFSTDPYVKRCAGPRS